MNEALAILASVVDLVKQFPELIADIEAVFAHVKAGTDPTPAAKALQVAAAEKLLGI